MGYLSSYTILVLEKAKRKNFTIKCAKEKRKNDDTHDDHDDDENKN